jgi:hypothetical protein
VKVFVNYRREDTAGDARLLYERLTQRFGADDVYFDVRLEPGLDWVRAIRSNGETAGAFLTLIGRGWMDSLRARSPIRAGSGEDVVRREIEWALRDWPGFVIPVLIGATMPEAAMLPRSIRGLCRRQAAELRHASFDRDAAALIERIERIEREGRDLPEVELPALDEGPVGASVAPRERSAQADSGVPAPNDDHYADVIGAMIEGTVVPVLGSSAQGSLPDADLLASHIADAFHIERGSSDLAEIAQYVAVTRGERRLYGAIKDALAGKPDPTVVHRFFAEFPRLVEELRFDLRPQMIITTGYDSGLERAFEDANEPFDYAVYSASDGWFVHFPWGERDVAPVAVRITEPHTYADFPIDEDGRLERTVIVKIHGGVDGQEGSVKLANNYVVTEDQYIDYLPSATASKLVPFQILDKLKSSQCLFLGYVMRDWNARVFMRRIWHGEVMSENSWAVEEAPDLLEKHTWRLMNRVELLAASLPEYVDDLRARLVAMQRSRVPSGGGAA